MPSLKANLLWYVIWLKYRSAKQQTEQGLLEHVRNTWRDADPAVPPPASFDADGTIEVSRERMTGGQGWEVFHCRPRSGVESDKVTIYWHGGAFIRRITAYHWSFIQKLILRTGTSVVVPIYTLAPLSTADAFTSSALDLLYQVSDDPRYSDREVVLAGDSAGGWAALRLIEALSGAALNGQERAERVLQRTTSLMMLSPLLNLEVTDEIREAAQDDPWLSVNLLSVCGRLWSHGAKAFPEFDFDVPNDRQQSSSTSEARPLSDAELSPDEGLEILQRAREKAGKPFRLLQFVGTADLCRVGTIGLQERCETLGGDVIKAETIVEPGLFHVYMLLDMPESFRGWEKVDRFMAVAA